ncbi:MAG: B12-binding domain-containing radical SAM protein [Candidatus Scalinduaceae bacterium]
MIINRVKFIMRKVLFVNAVDPVAEVENRYLPLWPAYLAAYAEKHLGPGRIDFRFMTRRLENELDVYEPDVVAIGSVSQNFNHALRYAQECKKRGLAVIVGGPHISALPQCLSEDMDVGCIGEGEHTFLELMQLFLDRCEFRADGLNKINGIVYRDGDRLVRTSTRRLIDKLDQIPHPNRSLVGYQRHGYMFTSRGCPYRCTFCASSRFWNRVRFASANYVVDEILELVSNGCKMISFYDDLFVTNKERVKKIADLLADRGLLGKVKFTCSCRVNVVTKELVELLKRLNVVSVGMGLESGSDRILACLKGNVTVEDNERAVNLFKEAGIQVNASFVIGSPDETEDEIIDTYKFIKRSRLDFVDTYVLTPFPGTPVWDFAVERGLVSENMDWRHLNVNFEHSGNRSVIVSQKLSRNDIKRLYRKFRRQRIYRILKALPGSPWLQDVPKAVRGMIFEKVSKLSQKFLFLQFLE